MIGFLFPKMWETVSSVISIKQDVALAEHTRVTENTRSVPLRGTELQTKDSLSRAKDFLFLAFPSALLAT